MKKWIRNIFFIIGVIGLIAIPEDLNKWMKIFGSNMDISTIVNQNIRWIVFGICMFVALIFSGIHRKIWCKRTILQIKFDKNDPRYIYDEYANYGVNIGEKISERTFRICIINLSKSKIIEGVEVKLTDIDKCDSKEKGKLPVRLKPKDNAENRNIFTIPINGEKFFDVICAYRINPKHSMFDFVIRHVEKKDNYTEIPLQFNAEKIDYQIKIEVKSNTTLCDPKYFMVGCRNELIEMWEA